jgi:hypothetical protein
MPNVSGLKDTQSNVIAGLGTFTYTVPKSGCYAFSIQSNLQPPSQLSVVINNNGTPIDSSTTPTINSTHLELAVVQACSINDVITFVLTSSAFIDSSQPPSIKSIININPDNQHS